MENIFDKDIINKHEIGMILAQEYSKNSMDPSTKVGACIMDDFYVISKGCNNAPRKWSDIPWERDVEKYGTFNTKYPYVIHAEMNAILKSREDLEGKIMYVTLFPCPNCAKLIVESGISMLIYKEYRDCEDSRCAKRLLKECGVIVQSYDSLLANNTNVKKLKLNINKGAKQ